MMQLVCCLGLCRYYPHELPHSKPALKHLTVLDMRSYCSRHSALPPLHLLAYKIAPVLWCPAKYTVKYTVPTQVAT